MSGRSFRLRKPALTGRFNLFSKILLARAGRLSPLVRALPFCLTLNVTDRCNLKCKVCNIWKSPRKKELTLDEYVKVFRSIKSRVPWLVITGGEPFLRDDIQEVIQSAWRYLKPDFITIASNGTQPGIIREKMVNTLNACPDTQFNLNLSLDGLNSTHDDMRGEKGSFAKSVETFRLLKEIESDKFSLGINITISSFNIGEAEAIFEYCFKLSPDSCFFEFAEERSELCNIGTGVRPSPQACLDVLERFSPYLKESRPVKSSRARYLLRGDYYRYLKALFQGRQSHVPCYAGTAFGQVSSDGNIGGCCVRAQSLGDLKACGYDFRKIWFSRESALFSRQVNKTKCHCTSVSSYYINSLCRSRNWFRLAAGAL